MKASQLIASHRRFIAEQGETVSILKSDGSRIDGVPARVLSYTPQQMTGSVVAGDVKVVIMAEDLAAALPIEAGVDQLELAGRRCEIKFADDKARRFAGTLIALELQVAA